jgi:hypothetical protein
MMIDRQQLANQVQALDGDRVKALVLGWLLETEGRVDNFSELLEETLEAEHSLREESNVVYGDIDENLTFQPLEEAEMIAKSLQVLEDYKRTRQGISDERVQKWLDSLGTENPLPCPK